MATSDHFVKKMSAGIYFAHNFFFESCILTRYGKKYDKNLFQVSTIAGGALQWREKHTVYCQSNALYVSNPIRGKFRH